MKSKAKKAAPKARSASKADKRAKLADSLKPKPEPTEAEIQQGEDQLESDMIEHPVDGDSAKPNPFKAIADETRARVDETKPNGGKKPINAPRQPDDPVVAVPLEVAEGGWFVNHEHKRVAGKVNRIFPKQSAVSIEAYTGQRQLFQMSFLAKSGYVFVAAGEIERLKSEGYTNSHDIKRAWVDPKAAPAMSEEDKAKLREISEKKKAERKELRADQPPKPPKAPKVAKSCLCGCGGSTMGSFVPGHDAKFKGHAKRVAAGVDKPDLTADQIAYVTNAKFFDDAFKAEIVKLHKVGKK